MLARPPDLLVASEGRLVAVRAADGSYLVSRPRAERFTQQTWAQRSAAGPSGAWPASGSSADGLLACTRASCVYRRSGHSVALIREAAALATACAGADLVVSPVPAGELCQAPRIIDSLATQKAGAHAVWLDPGGVRVETVLEWRGERRWTVP